MFTALKAEFYKNWRWRFERLVDLWGQYLADLYHVGFELNGKTWKVAVLGITGDAPFLREIPQPQLFKLEEVSYFNGFAPGNMLVVRRNQNQASLSSFLPHEISVLIELTLRHLDW